MKTAAKAKWVFIVWSILCLIGVVYMIVVLPRDLGPSTEAFALVGGSLQCLFLWLVVAVPAVIVYRWARKKEKSAQ